jgi:hypothetical protein
MAEIKVYDTYKEFYERICSGKEKDYLLTTVIPLGIEVTLGETPLPKRKGLRRLLPYKEERVVVCIGGCDNACGLLAVNTRKVKGLGGLLD